MSHMLFINIDHMLTLFISSHASNDILLMLYCSYFDHMCFQIINLLPSSIHKIFLKPFALVEREQELNTWNFMFVIIKKGEIVEPKFL